MKHLNDVLGKSWQGKPDIYRHLYKNVIDYEDYDDPYEKLSLKAWVEYNIAST